MQKDFGSRILANRVKINRTMYETDSRNSQIASCATVQKMTGNPTNEPAASFRKLMWVKENLSHEF